MQPLLSCFREDVMSAAPSPAAEAQPTPRNAQNQTQQKMGSRVSLQFLNRCFTYGRTFSARFWRTLPSYLPFYLLVIVVGHAGWKAQTPVTVITPFQQPKGNLPFSGEIVADALQDALT